MRGFWARPRRERGATAVEYALLLAGITLLIATALGIFGTAVAGLYAVTF